MFLSAAAAATGVPVANLRVQDGQILDDAGQVVSSYAELSDQLNLEIDISATMASVNGAGPLAWACVLPRLDLPEKILGQGVFIQDLDLPDMVHGRMIRPPTHGATLSAASERTLAAVRPPVTSFRDGNFIALLADAEEDAHLEATRIADLMVWNSQADLPATSADLPRWLREQPTETTVLHSTTPSDAAGHGGQSLRRTYSRPYIAHASIAPSCALAWWKNGRLSVWTHSQSIFHLRAGLAQALGLRESDVVVRHVQSAGCYGHNGADDAAFDAAFLAMHATERPVRVLWSRAGELGSAPVGSAMTADVSAQVLPDGTISGWSYDFWSNGFLGRPGHAGTPAFLGDSELAGHDPLPPSVDPAAAGGYGSGRNAIPAYDLNGVRVTQHRLLTMPIRTSALRALGAPFNVFAIESFMDELAEACQLDPVSFRIANLSDQRARAVIERAAEAAGWGRAEKQEGIGRGVGYARYKNQSGYCAVVAEVEAFESLKARRLVVVADVGRVVNLDGVNNQIEGGALQATSWCLREQVTFDASGITSTDWERYPILRFSEMPAVEVIVIDQPDAPSLGAGECVAGPVAAALGNALYDALGVRVRHLPLSDDNIVSAIETDLD
jgi:CO/xanthine dehydrogenase Mo-binding subunit